MVARARPSNLSAIDTEQRPEHPSAETRLFADEKGFFRSSRRGPAADPLAGFRVDPGPPYADDEARVRIREFLDRLTQGRPTVDDPDPFEYAQRNDLLILFGPGEQARFEQLLARVPAATAERWRVALAGGTASDAFGPMTEDEQAAEARVEQELRRGRRRVGGGAVAAVVVLAVVVGVVAWLRRDTSSGQVGAIRFDDVAAGPDVDRSGPPPKVEPSLLVRLDTPVAIKPGAGDPTSRIALDVDASALPQAPGSVAATLFRYGGRGQVVLVGADGWTKNACVEVSVLTAALRPLDAAYYEGAPGSCPRPPAGRAATVWCSGTNTVMLDLVLRSGDVALEEGGTASVASVRVKLVGKNAAYDSVSLNGRIQLDGGKQATVPAFGGDKGSEARFDVSRDEGAPIVGRCTLR